MVLQNSRLIKDKWTTGVLMLVAWIACQAIWLYLAFQLEFKGENTFYKLFAAGVALFSTHLGMLIQFMKWRVKEEEDEKDKIIKIE